MSAPGQDAVGDPSAVYGSPLFIDAGGSAPSQRLLGLPIVFSEKCAPLGTKGDILLIDWSKYYVGLRKDVTIDRSVHSGWSTDEVSFRAITRVDGQPAWASAMTPKKGMRHVVVVRLSGYEVLRWTLQPYYAKRG